MADSWLTDGNCKECRRYNYCNKPCKAHKQAAVSTLHAALGMSMLRAMAGVSPDHERIKDLANVMVEDSEKFGHNMRG